MNLYRLDGLEKPDTGQAVRGELSLMVIIGGGDSWLLSRGRNMRLMKNSPNHNRFTLKKSIAVFVEALNITEHCTWLTPKAEAIFSSLYLKWEHIAVSHVVMSF
jgi:hypothetical protein